MVYFLVTKNIHLYYLTFRSHTGTYNLKCKTTQQRSRPENKQEKHPHKEGREGETKTGKTKHMVKS